MTLRERMRKRGWKLTRRDCYWITHVEGVRCLIDTGYREGWCWTSWDNKQHPVVAAQVVIRGYANDAPYGIADVAQRCKAAARRLARKVRP